MTNKYKNQKMQISQIAYSIKAKTTIINKRVQNRYGELGEYKESEMKKLAISLISIQKRMSKLLMNL